MEPPAKKSKTFSDLVANDCELYYEFRELCAKGNVPALASFVEKNNYDVNTIEEDYLTMNLDLRRQRKSGLFVAALNGKENARNMIN